MYILGIIAPFSLILTVFWDFNLGTIFVLFPLVVTLLITSNTINFYSLVALTTLVGLIYDAWLVERLGIMGIIFLLGAAATVVISRNVESVLAREMTIYLIWYAIFSIALRSFWGISSMGVLLLLRWRRWIKG
ncbi:MAG TPA: hypothetical protein DHV12_01420 [Thermotogae bacterium]|nr:hypothetical protein [Thermotogota bacterium]HCZ05790.1 hypothetical protein [Thermotogota bacterium]